MPDRLFRNTPIRRKVVLVIMLTTAGALLLAGAASFWWLGGPDTHRWVARRALELATGREVQVDGTLEVEIGAAPLLRLSGLRIGNPPWAESPTLVQIERAEISVALLPLLRGMLAMPLVSLQGVIVVLETAPDGRQSWRSDGTPAGFRLPSLDRLSMRDVTVDRT